MANPEPGPSGLQLRQEAPPAVLAEAPEEEEEVEGEEGEEELVDGTQVVDGDDSDQ